MFVDLEARFTAVAVSGEKAGAVTVVAGTWLDGWDLMDIGFFSVWFFSGMVL